MVEQVNAMNYLAILYEDEKNIPKAIKYYKMAIEKDNDNAMNNLAKLYVENSEYLKKIICEINILEEENAKLKNKNERLKNKINYAPGGDGYYEAEEEFYKLCRK